jgi:hypothetical protein
MQKVMFSVTHPLSLPKLTSVILRSRPFRRHRHALRMTLGEHLTPRNYFHTIRSGVTLRSSFGP